MTTRLKAEIWVKAHLRTCNFMNIPAFVVRRGDNTAGIVLIKINRLNDNCMVLTPTTDFQTGKRQWLKGTGPEWVSEELADSYIEKQIKFDSDLWVLEIEDPEGRHLLQDEVID
ncbi:DUF1491 family protein [Sneathiella glossodoripedis]|uniref:DUF1491 family protein n=1 Tax=Sneathiella glossodoripedis TaxID=418853 RepID=UPI00046E533E|nr:DUF1491 family protein [Sneathiella glossodoripedis]